MDFEKYWNKALKHTEIIRARIKALQTVGDTSVPYVLLSESSINVGDTVVRTGEVVVCKPALIVPPNNPQFDGFDFENEDKNFDQNSLMNFLIVRGVSIPSLQYNNQTASLDVYEGKLSKAIKYYEQKLQQKEDVRTGLFVGPEDCWQFSLLIFICMQIARNAETDIKKLLDDYHRKDNL